MGKEFIGSLIMALGGFLLMVAIAGKVLDTISRMVYFSSSFIVIYIGMKIFRKYVTVETITPRDWIIMILAILTPFFNVFLLESFGMIFGTFAILIWLILAVSFVWKQEKIIDLLFPRMEKGSSEKSEEVRRMLNPRLYSWRVRKKSKKEC